VGGRVTVSPSQFLAAVKVVSGVGQWLLQALRETDDEVQLVGYLAYTARAIDQLESRTPAKSRKIKRSLAREAIAWRRAARFVSAFCFGPRPAVVERVASLCEAFAAHPEHRNIPFVVDRAAPRGIDVHIQAGRAPLAIKPTRPLVGGRSFTTYARQVCEQLGTWVLFEIRDAPDLLELAGFLRYTAHELEAIEPSLVNAWRRAASLAMLAADVESDVDAVAHELADDGIPYVVKGCGHRSLRPGDDPPRRAGRPRASERRKTKRVARSA